MIHWGRLTAVLLGVLVVSAVAHADMVSVSIEGIETRQAARACSEAEARPTDSASLFDYPSVTNFSLEPVQLSPEAGIDLDRPSQTQPPQILGDGQSSLSLCLSALIGLGLCSSAHYVKRLSFGSIPQWYHDGGPSQIGHSLAANPDSACPVPVCCFVQPVHAAEDIIPQYRSGTVVSLWRTSQYTPDVIASRGPPDNTNGAYT
jgi:hypothetical protein